MNIKALSLTQPWASLVSIGAKCVETRGWSTGYRGVLAIHAAGSFPQWARDISYEEYFLEALESHRSPGLKRMGGVRYVAGLPLGAVIGLVDLVDVQQVLRGTLDLSERELAFGDYTPGRFMWRLANPQPLATLYPCKGALGLWDLDLPSSLRLGKTA